MNDLKFLKEVQKMLNISGIETWIFGGWAEELLKMIPPRAHNDIDLLYLAEDFNKVDTFLLNNSECTEILPKHFAHKRAFRLNGIMVELFLVNKRGKNYITNFWGNTEYTWPQNTFTENKQKRIVSKDALIAFRRDHDSVKYIPEFHAVSNLN